MRLVVIESPYAGDVEFNPRYLRACMAHCIALGDAPYASHALYTQPGVLDDDVPEHRELGIRAGFAWGAVAEIRAVYIDLGMTRGMRRGVEEATRLRQEIEYRSIHETEFWDEIRGMLVPSEGS